MSAQERACATKLRYATAAEAVQGAKSKNFKYRRNNLKPYECPLCGGFHLTSITVRRGTNGGRVVPLLPGRGSEP